MAQARQKEVYDAKHQQGSFIIGQSVLLRNMKKLSKKGDKMSPNWTGPYVIIESLGKNMYRLRKKTGSKAILKSIYNSTRLKNFNERGIHVELTLLIEMFMFLDDEMKSDDASAQKKAGSHDKGITNLSELIEMLKFSDDEINLDDLSAQKKAGTHEEGILL